MATSGTYTFNLDIPELVDAAFEIGGKQGARAGYDLRMARRHLNLILGGWQNDGINLWAVDLQTQALTAGTASYALASSTQDVFDAYLRRSSIDSEMERISLIRYNDLPDKTDRGKPNQYVVVRGITTATIYLYPTPQNSTDVLYYWRVRQLQDIGNYTNTPDVPKRFLAALTWGLAWNIALGNVATEIDLAKANVIKGEYEKQYMLAREEDRERVDHEIKPDLRDYR